MTDDTLIDTSRPTLHRGMDFPTYLEDPADMPSLSSSTVKALLQTAPKRVWFETKRLNPAAKDKRKREFALGTAAHAVLVGMGEKINIIPYDSFRKKDAKEMRDEAYDRGHTPILEDDMDRVNEMAEAGIEAFAKNPDIGDLFGKHADSVIREGSIFWREMNIACRCRPDFCLLSTTSQPLIVHYKTTDNQINTPGLPRYAAGLGWEFIAAHYEAGVKALTGHDPVQFFAFQESQPPYLTRVLKLQDAFTGAGRMRRQRAMQIWARCTMTNTWPGYINRTTEISVPPWHETQQIAEKDAEQAIMQNEGKDPLDLALDWQAPIEWRRE